MKRPVALFIAIAGMLSASARAADVEFELTTLQLESPDTSTRPLSVGFGMGSGLALAISRDGSDLEFGNTGATMLRAEMAPTERLTLGLLFKPLESGGDDTDGSFFGGRIKYVFHAARGKLASWDGALVLGVGNGSVSSEGPGFQDEDVAFKSNVETSMSAVNLVFGRHVGERGLLFGGPSYTRIGYSADFERTYVTYGPYQQGGCFLFFCWGGGREVRYHTEASRVDGDATAAGLSLGYAARWPRGQLVTQLVLARVDGGGEQDTTALFMVGGDCFTGTRKGQSARP